MDTQAVRHLSKTSSVLHPKKDIQRPPGHESAESKGPETESADGSGEKPDGEGSRRDGRENGWVWPAKPAQIVAENDVLSQSTSLLYAVITNLSNLYRKSKKDSPLFLGISLTLANVDRF